MASSSTDSVTKRKSFSFNDKLKMIRQYDEEKGKKTLTRMALELGMPVSSLKTILKRRDEIEAKASSCISRRHRVRKVKNEELEDRLYEWFMWAMESKQPINGPILTKKAIEIAESLNVSDFSASTGWLDRFKKRRGIENKLKRFKMPGCSAVNCVNRTEQGFYMKNFPRDPLRRALWVSRVKRLNWTPTNNSYLCQVHFDDEQWEVDAKGKKKLKRYAEPKLFEHRSAPSKRKIPFDRSEHRVKIQSTQSLADDANKYERFAASIESSSGEKNYVHLKQEPADDSFILPDVGGGSDEKRPPTHQFSMVASGGLSSQQSSGQGISLQDFVAGQYGSDDVVGSIISPQQVVIAQYGTPLVVGGSSTGLQNPVLQQSATTSSSLVRESATTSPSLVRLSPATAAASSLVRQPVATASSLVRQPVATAAASSQSNGQKRVCIIGPGGATKKAAPSPSDDSTMTGASEEGEEDDDFWEPEHPIDTFFRSMAQTVKKFPAALAAETKLEVCRLVTMMELKMLKGGKPDAKSSTPLGGDPTVGSSKSDCGSDDL